MTARRVVTLTLLAVAFLGIGPPAHADWAEVKASGSLRVLITWPHDNYFTRTGQGGEPGIERELLEGFVRLHALKLEVVEVGSYDELFSALRDGRGDVIACNITATEQRRRTLAFSSEILPARQVVVTQRPHRVVQTLEELREERVATIAGTSMAEALAAAGVPKRNLDTSVPAGARLTDLLGTRGITATVEEVALAILRCREKPSLQMGMFLGPSNSMAWGVRKADTALLAALDAYLANVRLAGRWNQLVVKYFGESALDVLRRARDESDRKDK